MKHFYASLLIVLIHAMCFAQQGFTFTNNKLKVVIPVQIVNNLVIIPLKINSVPMQFLLDTGVEETILFSLDDKKELELFNVEKIKLRGLGNQDAVEGLKSIGNTLQISTLESKNETLILILDENFNLSASLGVEVNGIIGYKIFKEKCIEIDYMRKQIIIYENATAIKKIKNYTEIPFSLERNKPYVSVEVGLKNNTETAKMLVDCGSSDAIWLFKSDESKFTIPAKNFDDFLGLGLSGEIYGKRALLDNFSIDKFNFENAVAAYPDTLSVQKMNLVNNRSGSIGAEICSRFKIIFDYRNSKMFVKKNRKYRQPFQYNRSGLEIQHAGVRLIQEQQLNRISTENGGVKMTVGDNYQNIKYNFELKPNFEIISIRKGSPSDEAGLHKGDLILSINGVLSYRYKLQQINNILKSEDGKTIKLEIDRQGKNLKIVFKLKEVL